MARLMLAATVVAVAAGASGHDARAQPAEHHWLRIKSPFAAPLWRIAVDGEERFVATSSPYKAVSVWPLAAPEDAAIMRFPQRREQQLRAHAVAVSPDAESIAYSVPLAIGDAGLADPKSSIIYIARLRDQRITHKIEALPARAQRLRFSPDGRYFAAVLSDGCGLRVWSTRDWSLYAADDVGYGDQERATNCGLRPNGSAGAPGFNTTDVAFAGADTGEPWLVTSGRTGLRTYRKTRTGIESIAHLKSGWFGSGFPAGIAISPDRQKIAVGVDREDARSPTEPPRVHILSLRTLKTTGDQPGLSNAVLDDASPSTLHAASLDRVAWLSAGGREYLFAGGSLQCQALDQRRLLQPVESQADLCIARWDLGDGAPLARFIPAGTSRLMDVHAMQRHGALLYASQRRIAMVGSDGARIGPAKRSLFEENPAADFRDGRLDFRISPDGKAVSWRDYRSLAGDPLQVTFDLSRLTVREGPSEPPEMLAPDQDRNVIDEWRNTAAPPIINGRRLATSVLLPGEILRSAALLIKQRLAVIGSSSLLRIVGFSGPEPEVACQLPISEEAFRVNVTPDGKLAVVAHSDGTIRWYRIEAAPNGCALTPLLSAYFERIAAGEWSWIAWRPDGKFSNDPRARQRLEWVIEASDGQMGRVPFEQALDLYDRNAVISALENPASDATQRVASLFGPRAQQRMSVAFPNVFAPITSETVRFRLDFAQSGSKPQRLTVATGSGIKLAKTVAGKSIDAQTAAILDQATAVDLEVRLPPSVRTRRAVVHVCFFLDGEKQVCHPIQWSGPITPPPKRRLWAVLVGFSKHDVDRLTLAFAQNDALDLASLFARDYEERNVAHRSTIEPDYQDIHLDLVISPSSDDASKELAALSAKQFVSRRPATKQGIVDALRDIAARDKDGALSNDLLLFYYSGHGIAHPFNKASGRSGLVAPQFPPAVSPGGVAKSVLASDELLDLLDRISADKIIVLDACRTPVDIPDASPFDPGLMQNEFDQRELSAHFFFSASAGQFANEDRSTAFNAARPGRGNGLFTFAFLNALTNWAADMPGPAEGSGKIEALEIHRHIKWLFDPENAGAGLRSLVGSRIDMKSQVPIYVPARRFKNDVVRSLEPRSSDK